MLTKTEGNKERIEKIIKKQTNELAALREQTKLIHAKVEGNERVNAEVERIKKILADEKSFNDYDDQTVRVLIENIRVTGNGKILILLKGGIVIEENIS